jgi:hypothetical protein
MPLLPQVGAPFTRASQPTFKVESRQPPHIPLLWYFWNDFLIGMGLSRCYALLPIPCARQGLHRV